MDIFPTCSACRIKARVTSFETAVVPAQIPSLSTNPTAEMSREVLDVLGGQLGWGIKRPSRLFLQTSSACHSTRGESAGLAASRNRVHCYDASERNARPSLRIRQASRRPAVPLDLTYIPVCRKYKHWHWVRVLIRFVTHLLLPESRSGRVLRCRGWLGLETISCPRRVGNGKPTLAIAHDRRLRP